MKSNRRGCESAASQAKGEREPDLYEGTPPLEALKAIIPIAANHKDTFSVMRHVHTSKGSETCAGTTTSGGQNGHRTLGKFVG